MTVIGYNGSESKRKHDWAWMLESKKSYNTFKNSTGEQEQNIAEYDKKTFDYYLSNYVKAA